MRESEDSYSRTGIEYRRDTGEYDIHRISVCEVHKYRDKYMHLPMNTPHCKTHPSALRALAGVVSEGEHMEPENRMVTSGDNGAGESVSEDAIGAHRDKFSPK